MSTSEDLFEKAMAAVNAAEAAAPEVATPEPTVEAVAQVVTEVPAQAAPVPQPESPTDDAVLRRIMDRERQFEEQRASKTRELESLEAQYRARETELADRERALRSQAERLAADPAAFLKRLAPDLQPERVAEDLWFSGLGQKAPPDYRAKEPGRQALQRVLDLEESLKQEREARAAEAAQRAHEQAVRTLQDQLKAQVGQAGPENARISKLAQKDADLANRMLLDIAYMHAQQEGKFPAPEAVVKAAEAHLARVAKAWEAESTQPVAVSAPPAGGTISPTTSSLMPPKTKPGTGKADLRAAAYRAVGVSEVPEEY